MYIRNVVIMIITAISVKLSTEVERNKSLSDVAKLLAESPLYAIDNTHTGPSVMSQKGSKACGYFCGSDILQCLTFSNSVKTHTV